MHTPADLAQILPTLSHLSMQGHAYRVIDYKYLAANPPLHPNRYLYGLGAPASGARFTPRGGPQTIYMADDLATAFDEANPVQAILRLTHPGLASPTPPGGYASILYELETVLDLTDSVVQHALGTDTVELTKPWRQAQKRGRPCVTQILGRAIFDNGAFQAIRFESARVPGTYCLCVFIDRLIAPAHLEVYDPNNNIKERLP
ncbi:MAG: RES family NAD+ phosphorylase [Capsulimonas sp.]|uniref:RES family NAD+ phosphorylase n=1 Tax=Capsulimonas sp. TaxID=2494211 RepID=UPI003263BFA6